MFATALLDQVLELLRGKNPAINSSFHREFSSLDREFAAVISHFHFSDFISEIISHIESWSKFYI